jgi:hypothetical protein
MNRVSRNAPCPCGSGIKFKKCCLPKELEKQPPAKTYHDYCLELVVSLRPKILKFMKRAGYDQFIEEALGEYWRTLEPGLDPPEMDKMDYLQFLEWYIHDYPIPGHGSPVVQLFWESNPKLSAEERQVLQDWQTAYLSVFQIKEIEPGKGILAEDIFSGEEVFLSDVSLSQQTRKWELITFRKIKVLEEWQVSAAGSKEPPKYKEGIYRFVMDRFSDHQKHQPQADLPAFLREKGYLLNQRFQTLKAKPPQFPKIMTSSGEELAFWESRYDLDDFNKAINRLESEEDFEETDIAEDSQGNLVKAVYDWLERGRSSHKVKDVKPQEGLTFKSFFTGGPGKKAYRLLGTVILEPGQLVLEAQGRERLAVGKEILETVLSGLIRHRLDAVRSLESMLQDRPEKKAAKPVEKIPRETRLGILKDMYDCHYREWLDSPLPRLSGKTPRQAVKAKEGRRQVEDLLREMEYLHQQDDMEYDITWIRKALKL